MHRRLEGRDAARGSTFSKKSRQFTYAPSSKTAPSFTSKVHMRVAILHYWFLNSGGGERVVEALARIYPTADIFCLIADRKTIPDKLRASNLQCSFLNSMPFATRINRALLPLYPCAVSRFDFGDYDLIISSDSPPIKGIRRRNSTYHVSYCHTPGRYIWDLSKDFQQSLPILARPIFSRLAQAARRKDFESAQKVDSFIANSRYVARRIRTCYNRESTVIYPPVEVSKGYISSSRDGYYLSVGRLTAAKSLDTMIRACNQLRRRLLIVGTGREEDSLKAIAGPTIQFLGRLSDDRLPELYSQARAFVTAADEDFGIVSVEAQSYGLPVIAYGHGGSLETVISVDDRRMSTGVFFKEQTPESASDAIMKFEQEEGEFNPHFIREHARNFDSSVFEKSIINFMRALDGTGHAPDDLSQSAHGRIEESLAQSA